MTNVKDETKVSKTLSLPISVWELLEQIRSTKGLKNVNETMAYSVSEMAKKLGL